jgi:hypothetical protein
MKIKKSLRWMKIKKKVKDFYELGVDINMMSTKMILIEVYSTEDVEAFIHEVKNLQNNVIDFIKKDK